MSWTLPPLSLTPATSAPAPFPTHSLRFLATASHFTSPEGLPPSHLQASPPGSSLCHKFIPFPLSVCSQPFSSSGTGPDITPRGHPVTATSKIVSGFSRYIQGLVQFNEEGVNEVLDSVMFPSPLPQY